MMRKLSAWALIATIVALPSLSGCGGGGSFISQPVVSGAGTVRLTYESGFFVEIQGQDYQAQNLPKAFRKNGLAVKLRGRVVGRFEDPYGGTVYPVLEILEIEKLQG